MLQLAHLDVSVGKKKILKDVTFAFARGKIYAVMGPNGSGKSTLAYSIMGHPSYVLSKKSKLEFRGKNIKTLSPDERAKKGIFLSFQQPLSLAGVRVSELLHLSLSGKEDPLRVQNNIKAYARRLRIPSELLDRSLNEGASGGEKKKLEVLQAAVLDKDFIIFDEIDTGVDIDALKTIARFLNENRDNKTYVVITHYNRILKYLKPDNVLVMIGGRLAAVGDHTLADKIEKEGYENL